MPNRHVDLIRFLTNRPTIVEASIELTPGVAKDKLKLFGRDANSRLSPSLLKISKDKHSTLVIVGDNRSTNFASYGLFQGQWWQFNRPFIHTLVTQSDAQPIISTLRANEDALNFGIIELSNASLKFEGASFTGATVAGKQIHGRITGSEEDNESTISYSVDGKPWSFETQLLYNKSHTLANGTILPTRFISKVVTEIGGTFPVLTTEIISITTTNDILPILLLDPKIVFAKFGPFSYTMRSNGVLYFRPNLQNAWMISSGKDGSKSQPLNKAVVAAAFLIVSVGSLILLVKQYKTLKHHEN